MPEIYSLLFHYSNKDVPFSSLHTQEFQWCHILLECLLYLLLVV